MPSKKKKPSKFPYEVSKRSRAWLFKERITREGRLAEYGEKIKQRVEETGEIHLIAVKTVQVDMGMLSLDEERALYHEYLKTDVLRLRTEEERAKNREKAKENVHRVRCETFNEACQLLKNKGPSDLDADIDWVYNHPKMSEVLIADETHNADMRVSADDILYPPHGEAPSRGAATMLQQYMREPKEFMKLYVAQKLRQKKEEQDREKEKAKEKAKQEETKMDMYNDDVTECARLLKLAREIDEVE